MVERLEAAQIANARLNTVEEFLEHPQLSARGRWREVDSPVGPLRAVLPPVTMAGVEARLEPVPALGQHTDAILAELGLQPAEVAALRQAGAI